MLYAIQLLRPNRTKPVNDLREIIRSNAPITQRSTPKRVEAARLAREIKHPKK